MTATELAAVMKGIAPAIKTYVTESIKDLGDRLARVEARAALPGPQGEKGMGGAPGAPGVPGPAGPQGEPGPAGARGEKGEAGPVGPAGVAGRDGLPGVPGQQGEKGLDGKDGRDGIHGKDGKDALGFDDIVVEHDGERGFTFKFVRGAEVKTFGAFTVPVSIYRGVFAAGTSYEKGDQVTWGGSMWTALAKTGAKPGESGADSRAWVLTAQRGRDGKVGPAGPQGERGIKGDPGPQGRSGY